MTHNDSPFLARPQVSIYLQFAGAARTNLTLNAQNLPLLNARNASMPPTIIEKDAPSPFCSNNLIRTYYAKMTSHRDRDRDRDRKTKTYWET